ncbi:MAG: sigma-70 family RNA polymerase sigma factor [Oscillospiraceae bacterium]|nr:sigma-70 family RNA polymerase sigma factor [Oscillospiraceae bacterium]
MEDAGIVALYWARNEQAIQETREKYGGYCYGIAVNLLGSPEDAEETVSDTWQAAWNAMPPERPVSLRAWLGRVVRNLSLSRWNREHRKKRDPGMTALLSELEDCLPSPVTVEGTLETRELGRALDAWLGKLSPEDRRLFLRRYWYGMPLQDLAKERGLSPARLAQKMLRLRRSLRTALEKEGISL